MGATWALIGLALRRQLGRHRWGLGLFLLGLALLPTLIGVLTLKAHEINPVLEAPDGREVLLGIFRDLQFPLLYPLIALVLMAGALRDEIQHDTIAYLWLKPLPRGALAAATWAGALLGIWALVGLSTLLAGAALAPPTDRETVGLIGKLLLVAGVGTLAYGALFFALGVWVERPLLWGFAYLLGWEEVFSRVSPTASRLSVRHHVQGLFNRLVEGEGASPDPSLGTAVAALVGVAVVALAIAGWRFSRMEFPGAGAGD